MEKNLEYYLKLPYSYSVNWSDADNCYLGSIVELEHNMTCGDTPEETIKNLKEALTAYIETSLANGFEIAEPVKLSEYKGNITYRTTKEKHYKLARTAKLKGVSINSFIDEAVTEKLKESA
ncbi:MAG: type II toxin-antitoxin system HicB family antitoxin [Candidatus Gastranaerophilales bacterium]|nr:type II toxin-antitoxin system HicB family antitoxin [Candidatus Gastranaerophilales bacterium]